MQETDLQTALAECQKSAKVGYRIASAQERVLSRTLSDAQTKVQKTIDEMNRSQIYVPETDHLLEEQLFTIKSDFNQLSHVFKEDLVKLEENLSKFSITLFGRTTAGKSTLMEILREGDGEAIGKGGQRTTRVVRHYSWNGLDITDVPGIAAYKGAEDERVAFEATKGADLVLFLIDAAPQYEEAKWFSKIMALGKPVLCIVNVKVSVSEDDDINLIEWEINDSFNSSDLEDIRTQFLEYSEQFGQTWKHVPFTYVHLRSAYLSQHEKDEKRSQRLYSVSRMANLESLIVKQVINKGQFYRIKTFVDVISNPLIDSMSSLLDQSQINSLQGRTVLSKKKQLKDWRDQFGVDSISQIGTLIAKIRSDLKSEVATFVEDHFDDENAAEAWENVYKTKSIEERCQSLLEKLEFECNDKLLEVSREITKELEYSTAITNPFDLSAQKVVDSKKVVEWSSLVLSGTLVIASAIAFFLEAPFAATLGTIATVVSFVSAGVPQLLKSRTKKEALAREKLKEQLIQIIETECVSLQEIMEQNLNQMVLPRIDNALLEMDAITRAVFSLADTQQSLAWDLNERLLTLNRQIVGEALSLIGREDVNCYYSKVARIPGNTSLLLLSDGIRFPDDVRRKLSGLMSERINFIYDSESKRVLISRVLGKGVDRSQIGFERKINVAHVPLTDVTPEMNKRIIMAQQLSGILLMK